MDINPYSEFWEQKNQWFLSPIGDMYLILGHNEKGEVVNVTIEDDEVYEAVIQKMIDEGVKILSEEEVEDIFPQPPSDLDIDGILRKLEENQTPREDS